MVATKKQKVQKPKQEKESSGLECVPSAIHPNECVHCGNNIDMRKPGDWCPAR